jgi:L-threonine-O-3-phosphate decarboxylase
VHGGPDEVELRGLGIDPDRLIDFSVCTNPFGPSPRVYQALAMAAVERYPDRDSHALRAALAAKHSVGTERILVGNGVSELIWLTSLAFARPRRRVLVIGPTYGEYARSALLQGAEVISWDAREHSGFVLALDEIEAELRRCQLVFLCNPNNPTGAILLSERLLCWARRYPRTLFIVDEAYQNFAPGSAWLVSATEKNVLVLRSMTKDYALAGLRVGYAVGCEETIAALDRVRPPWSVNVMAQAAAEAALGDEHHLSQSLAALTVAKQALVKDLEALGLAVWPSATHFFLVRVGNAAAWRRLLLARGILVRDAASFGLPAFLRLATRRPEDNARLLEALADIKQAGLTCAH